MFGIVRTAVRFFFIGLVVGALLAPRSGAETRRLIREKVSLVVGGILEIADLPPVEPPVEPGTSRRAAGDGRARPRRVKGTHAGTTPG